MKNIYTLLGGLILFMSSCSEEGNQVKNDLEKENLKGDVKYIQYLREPLCLDQNIEFDDDGFIVRKTISIPSNNIYEEFEYFYENGKVVKNIYSTNNGGHSNMNLYFPTTSPAPTGAPYTHYLAAACHVLFF